MGALAIPFDYHAIAHEISPGAPRVVADATVSNLRDIGAPAIVFAHDLLSTRDAADFTDALDEMVSKVDTWALPQIPTWDFAYDEEALQAALGPPLARRLIAAMVTVAARSHDRPDASGPVSYADALYSEYLPPFVRIQLCNLMGGLACSLALVVALDTQRPLSGHLARGLVEGVERSAAAVVMLDSQRA